MKIIVCGPPHSGKSVFIANLEKYLPSDSFITIRVNRDGEGIWSNNKDQDITKMVREKYDYGNDFIKETCKVIDRAVQSIVLVDIGGRLSKDKLPIVQSCDSFIVLSNNEDYKNKWRLFGNYLGLDCIASLDSSLQGTEQIYGTKPYFQGKITKLERGNSLQNSKVLENLANIIVEKSKYKDTKKSDEIIDFNDVAEALGCVTYRNLPNGSKIRNAFFTIDKAPDIYNLMQKNISQDKDYKINCARANWVSGIAVSALLKNGAKNISIFDSGFAKYIPIKKFEHIKNCTTDGLKYNIIESKDSVFLDVDITNARFTLEEYQKCKVPQINTDKTLYLSGKLPLWLFNSISASYNSKEKFAFQPGNGFICYESENIENLGALIKEPLGIDLTKYFLDKKNKNLLTSTKDNDISK